MREADGTNSADQQSVVEERTWLGLVAGGGPRATSAMGRLHDRYRQRFASFVRSHGLQEADIQDVTQNAWLAIAKKAGGFWVDGTPQPWFWSIVRRELQEFLRQNQRKVARFASKPDGREDAPRDEGDSVSDEPAPDGAKEAKEFRECLEQAFSTFGRRWPNDAHWLRLLHALEWDVEALARHLDMPIDEAKTRLKQMRPRFARIAQPCRELKPD